MNPRLRLALALYTATTAAGAGISGEPIPAAAMVFALGYQAKAGVEAARRGAPGVSATVKPEVRS